MQDPLPVPSELRAKGLQNQAVKLGKGFVLLELNRVNFRDATGVGHVRDATTCPWALAESRMLIMYLVPETR